MLEHVRTAIRRSLRAEHVIGRGHGTDLTLDDPVASGLHAVLRWSRSDWEVRDLGSRNGVFVDGARIAGSAHLLQGARVGFGTAANPWQLVDAAGPVAFATAVDGDATEVHGTRGTLGLPDVSAEVVSIHHSHRGWIGARGADEFPIEDREVIEASGRWRVHLPHAKHLTTEGAHVKLDAVQVTMVPSQDLEHIEVTVAHAGSGTDVIGHYAANELLLVLALARRDDLDEAPAEQGWVHFDDLCGRLSLDAAAPRDENRVRQWIHQCRRRFERLGIVDGARIVERRAGTRQVRLGVVGVAVEQVR